MISDIFLLVLHRKDSIRGAPLFYFPFGILLDFENS